MALKGLVKISSVNNLSDARYVAGMGVDLMGFDLEDSSESRISPAVFAAITGWVSGVKLVGEFRRIDSQALPSILKEYSIDLIQVSDPKSSDITKLSLPLIIKITQPDKGLILDMMEEFSNTATYFLWEFNQPLDATDLTDSLVSWSRKFPIILGSSLTPQESLRWFDQGVSGIALRGGNEIKPGYKDFDELADILEALEVDDLI